MASTSALRLDSSTSLPSSDSGEFVSFEATMRLPIAPIWAADGKMGGKEMGAGGMEGVREVLAGWVMRYLPPLRCVLLTFDPLPAYQHPTVLFPASASPFSSQTNSSARNNPARLLRSPGIDTDESDDDNHDATGEKKVPLKVLPMIEGSGFTLARISFKGIGWRPKIGQKLVGSPTLSTPSHISLLLHNLFNATISSDHIPQDEYTFDADFPVPESIQARQKLSFPTAEAIIEEENQETEKELIEVSEFHGKPENDEEMKDLKEQVDEGVQDKVEDVDAENAEDSLYRESGWWVNRLTGKPLGNESGKIEFTVIGLTVPNSMITVTGSLLSSPFSVAAPPTKPAATKSTAGLSKASAKLAEASALKRKKTADEAEQVAADDASESSRSPTPERPAPPKVVVQAATGESASESDDEEEEDVKHDKVKSEGKKRKHEGETKEERKKRRAEKKLKKEEKRAKKARA